MQSTFSDKTAARTAIGCALVLGLAAQYLLFNAGPTGLGWVIWVALFGISAVIIVRQGRFSWQRETAIAAVIATAAAVIPVVRASEALIPLSMLVLVTVASIPMLRARSLRFGTTPVLAQLLGLPTVGAHAAVGVLPLVARDIGHDALPARFIKPKLLTAARGALLAVPFVVVFGALFVSADPLFDYYLRELTKFVSEEFLGRVFFALLLAWITAGLMRGLLPRRSPLADLPAMPTVPAAELAIVLGAVTALFTLFVLVQARWLFNGADALHAATGLTVADFARRGFFELVAAAALTLPLLLVADSVAGPATGGARRAVRLLSGALVVLVFVVMASALERMMLYTERFGLTEQRLYATAFMAWLGLVFAWYAATTLRGRRLHFAAGPVTAGIILVFAMAALNPDALITRVNLERARNGAPLDEAYLAHLSADAVPELIRNFGAIPSASRCVVAKQLLRHNTGDIPDWRGANRSALRARELVNRNAPTLKQLVEKECVAQG